MSQDPGSATPMSERMQSLLSRAVEDQLSEQRQLAGALTDVRAQLTRLAGQLDTLQAGVGNGPSAAALEQAVTGLAGDTREGVRLIGERLDTVGRMVQQRGHDLAEVRAALDEVRASVEEQTKALGAVGGGLSALPAFGERIETLQGGLSGVHDRLRGMEELTAAVDSVQRRAEAMDGTLRELRSAFTGVASRAAELPGKADLDSGLARAGEQLDVLANRLGRVEAALPSLLERLDSIDSAAAAHGNRLDEVREQLAEVGTEVPVDPRPDPAALSSIEEKLGALRDRLEEMSAAPAEVPGVAELGDRLDEMHESLFGEGGLRDEVQALADVEPAPGVDELVAGAVAASEQRLTAHIDDAVLALAEALLRRRSPRESGRSELLIAATAMAPAEVADEDDEALLDDEDLLDEEEDEDEDDETSDSDSEPVDEDDSVDLRDELVGAAEPAAPVPPGSADNGGQPAGKRKRWWRSSS